MEQKDKWGAEVKTWMNWKQVNNVHGPKLGVGKWKGVTHDPILIIMN